MELEATILAFESRFKSIRTDWGYKHPQTGEIDMRRTSTGLLPVTITSGGVIPHGGAFPILYGVSNQNAAIDAWADQVVRYAVKMKGDALWWEVRPRMETRLFQAIQYTDMLVDDVWRGSVSIELCSVVCRLAIGVNE